MSLYKLIDDIKAGKVVDVKERLKNIGSIGMRGGIGSLEFWYKGQLQNTRIIREGRKVRTDVIEKMLRKTMHLKGERYFIWKPNN